MNLCSQAFIVGKDAEKVCKELATEYRDNDMKTVKRLWWHRGGIRLLHNIVRYIRIAPQRRGLQKDSNGGLLAEFDALEVSSPQLYSTVAKFDLPSKRY